METFGWKAEATTTLTKSKTTLLHNTLLPFLPVEEKYRPLISLKYFFYAACVFRKVNVRYHCGGWSEEVNSCILNISYMVYLKPKHSLGYQLHSYPTIIIMHIYNWYHSDIHHVHKYAAVYHRAIPLLSAFPFPFSFAPLSSPFTYLEPSLL